MNDINDLTISGVVAYKPEAPNTTAKGNPVASFKILSKERFEVGGDPIEREVFVLVRVYDSAWVTEHFHSLQKGDRLMLRGKVTPYRTNPTDKEAKPLYGLCLSVSKGRGFIAKLEGGLPSAEGQPLKAKPGAPQNPPTPIGEVVEPNPAYTPPAPKPLTPSSPVAEANSAAGLTPATPPLNDEVPF